MLLQLHRVTDVPVRNDVPCDLLFNDYKVVDRTFYPRRFFPLLPFLTDDLLYRQGLWCIHNLSDKTNTIPPNRSYSFRPLSFWFILRWRLLVLTLQFRLRVCLSWKSVLVSVKRTTVTSIETVWVKRKRRLDYGEHDTTSLPDPQSSRSKIESEETPTLSIPFPIGALLYRICSVS